MARRVGVGVGGDRQVPVGAVVGTAPQLVGPAVGVAQEGQAGVGEQRRPPLRPGPAGERSGGEPRPQGGARVAARHGRPPGGRAEQRRAGGQQGGPAVVAGPVQQQAVAVVGVALAGRAQAHVDDGGQGVGHAPQGVPDLVAERMAGQLALQGGGQAELEHEAVVFGGQLAVQAAGERLPHELAPERGGGRLTPGAALREPGERAAGRELPGHLGEEVVVGRRPVTRQPGQPLLVVMELLQEGAVALEQRPGPGPAVEQPADPDPGQQPQAELDAAGPVDAGQERVGGPPRAELRGHGLGVPLVAIEAVGGCQHRQVLVARSSHTYLTLPTAAVSRWSIAKQ